MKHWAAVGTLAAAVAVGTGMVACGGDAETSGAGGSATGSGTGTGTGTGAGTTTGTATGSGTTAGTPTGAPSAEPHDFSVTIDNQSSATIFVDGLLIPFDLEQGSDQLRLWALCECSECGTGSSCPHGDPAPWAIELPAGETMLVETSLIWYTSESVTDAECSEASFYGSCDLAHSFAAGTYETVVRYDDEAAITGQGLEETTNTKYGHTVWVGPGIGTVMLSQEERQSFELSGDATTLTVTIAD